MLLIWGEVLLVLKALVSLVFTYWVYSGCLNWNFHLLLTCVRNEDVNEGHCNSHTSNKNNDFPITSPTSFGHLKHASIMLLCCGSNTVILGQGCILIQAQNNVPQNERVALVHIISCEACRGLQPLRLIYEMWVLKCKKRALQSLHCFIWMFLQWSELNHFKIWGRINKTMSRSHFGRKKTIVLNMVKCLY